MSRLLSVLANIQSTYSSVNAIACHTNKVAEIAENNRIIINSTQPWNHYLNAGPVSFDVIYYRNSIPLSSCLFDKNSVIDVIESHKLSSPAFSGLFYSLRQKMMFGSYLKHWHFIISEKMMTLNLAIIP